MKKVLIITYYWPPSGGAGVQRWLKFVKYLRNFGWEPIIYTPLNPGFSVYDETLIKDIPSDLEVIKRPIWEPYEFYKKLTGKKSVPKTSGAIIKEKKTPGVVEQISVWIRGNLFIPDARKFWINPSIRYLSKYLKKNHIDAIVSTGPPHSAHLIALKLKNRFRIPWLADFRDPWTDIDYYREMRISAFADRKHKRLELLTIKGCDAMVVVSQDMKDNYEKMGGNNIHLITNGFDPEDMDKSDIMPNVKFSISHIGTLPPGFNLRELWQVLSDLVEIIPGFSSNLDINLIGNVDESIISDIDEQGLRKFLSLPGYVSHEKAAILMKQSAVLLLVINHNSPNAKGIITGKFFEYLASRRPILAIGPAKGDLAKILEESEAGDIAEYNDNERIKSIVMRFYRRYLNNDLFNGEKVIEKYTRKSLTSDMANVLNMISGK